MGKQYSEISETLQGFIEAQKLFFVATAANDGRVNVSPKGMDSLRVLGSNRVAWLNVTGSGNETAAHLLDTNRMTLMFCAFEGSPMILRLYGRAKAYHPRDQKWQELLELFPTIPGSRNIFDMTVDLVQTSCGMAVPYFDFVAERDDLKTWATNKGEKLGDYWLEKNQRSIDGMATGILEP